MATVIIFSTNDGYVQSDDVVYATARTGPGDSVGSSRIRAGQSLGYTCYEGYLDFAVQSRPQEALASAALSLNVLSESFDVSDGEWRVRVRDYGASIETTDWVAGEDLAGLTLVAHVAESVVEAAVGAYFTFVDDALVANLVLDGNTRLLIHSDKTQVGTVPTGNAFAICYNSTTAGTASDPYLTVEYVLPRRDLYAAFPKPILQRAN
jgi:hypothetical protein